MYIIYLGKNKILIEIQMVVFDIVFILYELGWIYIINYKSLNLNRLFQIYLVLKVQ